MRSRIVLVASAASVIACGGLAPAPLTVGQVERDVALDAADVAAFSPGLTIDPARETWRYERVWDGSIELESVAGVSFDQPGSMDVLLASQLAAFDAWNP